VGLRGSNSGITRMKSEHSGAHRDGVIEPRKGSVEIAERRVDGGDPVASRGVFPGSASSSVAIFLAVTDT
jgi:hypothetical protein